MYFVYIHLFAYLCVYAGAYLHVFIGVHNKHAYIHAQTLIYTCSMCVCARAYMCICLHMYSYVCVVVKIWPSLRWWRVSYLPRIFATQSHPRASHCPKDISVRSHIPPFGDLYTSKPLPHQGLPHSEGPNFEPEALANRSFIIFVDTYVTLSSSMFITCNT